MLHQRLVAIALLLLAGCSDTAPMASPQADAGGKRFDAPAPGRSAVYIFRPDGAGGVLEMTANQRNLGQLPKRTYLRIDVTPGNWDIRCRSDVTSNAPNSMVVALKADTIHFIEARYSMSAHAYCRLSEAAADHGRHEVSTFARIQEVGGASD
jgi:hypothetical protein